MKVNSISGITCHVEDLAKAAEFYETIGFRRGKEESDRVTFYVNWFSVTLVSQHQAEASTKGAGLFLYLKVDDVEEFHRAALSIAPHRVAGGQVNHHAGDSAAQSEATTRSRAGGVCSARPSMGPWRARPSSRSSTSTRSGSPWGAFQPETRIVP
jgi:catechol 2,3-dioxygenase-like lactoylglutathione lyase family enzyme